MRARVTNKRCQAGVGVHVLYWENYLLALAVAVCRITRCRQQLIPQLASAQLLQRAIISAILVVQNRAHGIQTQQLGPCSRGRSGVTESGCFSLWMKLLPRPVISAISRIGTLPAARASFFARRQRSA